MFCLACDIYCLLYKIGFDHQAEYQKMVFWTNVGGCGCLVRLYDDARKKYGFLAYKSKFKLIFALTVKAKRC